MTAKMDNSFINFVDFMDVAIEAYDTAPKKLFEKMMRMMKVVGHKNTRILELDGYGHNIVEPSEATRTCNLSGG